MSLSNKNVLNTDFKNPAAEPAEIKDSVTIKQDVPEFEKQPEEPTSNANPDQTDNLNDSMLTENGERQAAHNYKIYLEYLKLTEGVINRNFKLQAQ